MKPFKLFFNHVVYKRKISFWLLLFSWGVASHTPIFGGVLVTTSKMVELGELTEEADQVLLQIPDGSINYRKDVLLWYSLDTQIDTLLKAARLAQSQDNTEIAVILFQQSAKRETDTRIEAELALEEISQQVYNKAANVERDPKVVAEEKLAQAKRLLEHANNLEKMEHLKSENVASSGGGGGKGGGGKGGGGHPPPPPSKGGGGGNSKQSSGAFDLKKLDKETAAAARAEAKKLTAEANKILATIKAQDTNPKEVKQKGKPREAIQPQRGWTGGDMLANGIVAGVVILIVFSIFCGIVGKPPQPHVPYDQRDVE